MACLDIGESIVTGNSRTNYKAADVCGNDRSFAINRPNSLDGIMEFWDDKEEGDLGAFLSKAAPEKIECLGMVGLPKVTTRGTRMQLRLHFDLAYSCCYAQRSYS